MHEYAGNERKIYSHSITVSRASEREEFNIELPRGLESIFSSELMITYC